MRNPLRKRLLRELKSEFGKYLVIFVFLAGMIALVSGFIVADDSLLFAYNQGFEKYNIEDGNFELDSMASQTLLDTLENNDKSIYPNFYFEEETREVKSTLRVFKISLQIKSQG